MSEDSPTELFCRLLDDLTSGTPVLFSSSKTEPWFEQDKVYEIDKSIYLGYLQTKSLKWATDELFVVEEEPAPMVVATCRYGHAKNACVGRSYSFGQSHCPNRDCTVVRRVIIPGSG